MMCFKDLKRNLTAPATERTDKLQSSAFRWTSSRNSTRSSSSYTSKSDSSRASSSLSNHSTRATRHQDHSAPDESNVQVSNTRQTEAIDGVILRRDSKGKNWFHGPDGMRKKQIGWKIPINRIDPEINANTSHGRRSQLAIRNEEERSVSRQNHMTAESADNSRVHDRSSSRRQLRRISTIGTIADIRGFETMSIESVESVEAAIGPNVNLSDSESEFEADGRRERVQRKAIAFRTRLKQEA